LFRNISVLLGGLLILGGMAFLFANLYLQSQATRERLCTQMSLVLGMPVEATGISLTPWGGLVVHETSIPDSTGVQKNVVEIEAVKLRLSLLSFIRGRTKINEAIFFSPVIVIKESEDGTWTTPPLLPVDGGMEQAMVDRSDPSDPSDQTDQTDPVAPLTPPVVKAIKIVDAQLRLINKKDEVVLSVNDGSLSAAVGEKTAGTLRVGEVVFYGRVRVTDAMSPFSWDGRVVDLPSIVARFCEGKLTGEYHLDASQGQGRFDAKLALEDAQVPEFFTMLGASNGVAGTLAGELAIEGIHADPATFTGGGKLVAADAKIRPLEVLVLVGTMFSIDEFQILDLSEVSAPFTIKNGHVEFADTALRTKNLVLDGHGTVGFDGALDIAAALRINQTLQRQFRAVLSSKFRDTDDPEYKQIDFNVRGDIASPQTDLLANLGEIKIVNEIGGLINSIFGPGSKKPEQEKPKGTTDEHR